MDEKLTRKERGFYTSEDHARPTYPNLPQRLFLLVPKWTLRSTIKTLEWSSKQEKPWEVFQTRKGDRWDNEERSQLPLELDANHGLLLTAHVKSPEDCTYGIIEENGTRAFAGTFYLQISAGNHACGYMRHWPPMNGGPDFCEEAIHFSLTVPREEMEWLRDKLASQPSACLGVSLYVAAFQHDGEAMGAEYWQHQTYRFEPDSFTPILEFSLTVQNDQEIKALPGIAKNDLEFHDEDGRLSGPAEMQREQSSALLMQVLGLSQRIRNTQIALWVIAALLVCSLLFK